MKKFSKLLTLLLAVVTILTVFTVVTLASDEEPTFTASHALSINFQNSNPGDTIANDAGKYGKMTAVGQDNGNVYMLISYEAGTANFENMDFNVKAATYNFASYPLMTFDFDIMSADGNFAYGYIHPRAFNGGTSLGYLNNSVRLNQLFLENTPNVWHHVTIVAELDANKNIVMHIFADGKKVNEIVDTTFTSKFNGEGYDMSQVGLTYAKFAAQDDKTATTNSTAVDNITMTYFTAGATIEDAASYRFNDSYKLPYTETVATVTDANENITYFDNLQEAVDAANAGDTVTLTAPATEAVIVDKAITVNASEFTLLYSTAKGFAPSVNAGVYTFEKAEQNATVTWNADSKGYVTAATTEVALGVAPAFNGKAPYVEFDGGRRVIRLAGWSYENDGTVDKIKAITEDDLANGITLYPVLEEYKPFAAEIVRDGYSVLVKHSLFTKIFSATNNTTIKLIDNVTLNGPITLVKDTTHSLDLNGFTLMRYAYTYTDYAASWDDASGKYVKGEQIEAPAAVATGALFTLSAQKKNFTLYSSVPGAEVYNIKVTATRWLNEDGEVVKIESSSQSGHLLFEYGASVGSNIQIKGEGITFYCGGIAFTEHGSNVNALTFSVDGGTFVKLSYGNGLFTFLRGGTFNVSNAKFYANGGYLVRANGYNTKESETLTYNFTNCDIIDGTMYLGNKAESTYIYVNFINCRADLNLSASGTAGSYGTILYGKGTKATTTSSQVIAADESVEIATLEEPISKTYVVKTGAAIDPVTAMPSGVANLSETVLSFKYAATSVDNDYATITWKDADGYTIKTTKAPKNDTALAPTVKIPAGDSYRAIVNPNWLGADGKISDLSIGNDDAYTFTATLEGVLDCDKEYVAYMTDARLSLVYYAHFGFNLYAPVVDGVTIKTIGGSAPNAKTVLVGGVEYKWRTVGYAGTTSALDNLNSSIVYTIDGITYTANFTFNVMLYAELMVTDEAAIEEEKEAVACLVRYVEEACKYKAENNTLSAATQKIFDDFYTNYYTPKDYVTSYPANEIHNVNEAAIAGLIGKIEYKVISSKVTFAVTLSDDVTPTDYKIFFTGVAYRYESQTADKKTYYIDNRTLTGYLMNSTYTLTVHDANGNTVVRDLDGDGEAETKAEIKYSMATYITLMEAKGENVDLAKALYAFGKAVIAARDAIDY